jgi:hypothetical protein
MERAKERTRPYKLRFKKRKNGRQNMKPKDSEGPAKSNGGARVHKTRIKLVGFASMNIIGRCSYLLKREEQTGK